MQTQWMRSSRVRRSGLGQVVGADRDGLVGDLAVSCRVR